jgi:hypothetical protein
MNAVWSLEGIGKGEKMDAVKITFDNGQTMVTDFNSQVSREEIAKYYVGNWFNLGSVSDDMHKCIKIEFLK